MSVIVPPRYGEPSMLSLSWQEVIVYALASLAALGAQAWAIVRYFWNELKKRDEAITIAVASTKLDAERLARELAEYKLYIAERYGMIPGALEASEKRTAEAITGLSKEIGNLRDDFRETRKRIDQVLDQREVA